MNLALLDAAGSGGAPFNPASLGSSLLAQYDMQQGAAPDTVYDISGSGNNATRGSAGSFKPAWAADGLVFSGATLLVEMPVGLCVQTKTVIGCCDIIPRSTDVQSLVIFGGNHWQFIHTDGMPGSRSNPGTPFTVPSERQQGCVVWAQTFDTANGGGRWYWNGIESRGYVSRDATLPGAPPGGSFWFGCYPGVGHVYIGTMRYLALVNSVLSPSQIRGFSQYIAGKVAARGVTVGDVQLAADTRVICDGDSLTAGTGSTIPGDYPYQLRTALSASVRVSNIGIGGQTISQLTVDGPARVDTLWPLYSGTKVYLLWIGRNDLRAAGSANAHAAAAAVLARADAALAAGANKVLIGNAISGTDILDADRATFNADIAAGCTGNKVLMDFNANANLGAANACNNATYFAADKIHLVNAGYAIVKGIAQTALSGVGVT